jgi:hypothetical protein
MFLGWFQRAALSPVHRSVPTEWDDVAGHATGSGIGRSGRVVLPLWSRPGRYRPSLGPTACS